MTPVAENQSSKWQLFIPSMSPPPGYSRLHLDVCFHEAGHALAFALIGLPIASVTVCNDGGALLMDRTRMKLLGEPPIDTSREMLESCALLLSSALFAGVQTEFIQRGIPIFGRLSLRDTDTISAHEILTDVFSCIDEPAWRAQRTASNILNKYWDVVSTLAQRLDACGTLSNDDVLSAMPRPLPSHAELLRFIPRPCAS